MKAIIYSRVSHTTGQSTSRQINELKSIDGYEVKKTFQESISGYTKSIDERPELQKALEYVYKNKIEVFMVHEISRLGRRTSEILVLLDSLKKKGVKVFVKSLGILINDNGATEGINRLVVNLMVDLSRLESENLSFRIKSGLQERKRKGFAIGRQLGSVENEDKFLAKHSRIIKHLNKGESIRWIASHVGASPTTVQKVKSLCLAH
ncbi:MAG: recombinase family protein [Reichenbachiella sp.]